MAPISRSDLAARLEPSLLRPDVTFSEVDALCGEARRTRFATVVLLPFHVKHAVGLLAGSGVRVCAVVGFPFGANEPETKGYEADGMLSEGADELDLVMNIGAFKSNERDVVEREICDVANLVHKRRGRALKVIIETGLLTNEEIQVASQLVTKSGADFVKTGTGFGPRGATVEDVRLIRKAVGTRVGIKAAGGIRSYDLAVKLVEAGADRLGTSQPMSILSGAPE